MLPGTELFFRCLKGEQIILGNNKLILQNTQFRWVIPLHSQKKQLGKINKLTRNKTSSCILAINDSSENSLLNAVQQFWQVKNISLNQNKLTNKELD